ncbi:MAG: hypothetical protein AB7V16_08895 [Vulcanibacillus sp.]
MDMNLIYFLGVLSLFLVVFLIRLAIRYWASGQVATIMLGVEKKLSTWAKEKAAEGKDKRAEAERIIVNKFYCVLPSWIKPFITEQWLIDQIEKIYVVMLDYLDDSELNKSVE